MNDLKAIIAKNISFLRNNNGMTQLELGEKLNYSDKAVSKWERGESVPDVIVLKNIADLFSVSLDYLVTEVHTPTESITDIQKKKTPGRNKKIVLALSLILVLLVATFGFVIMEEVTHNPLISLICFVYAIPVGMIVWLVFNSLWFNTRINYSIISFLMWSTLIAIFITMSVFISAPVSMFLLGIPGQIAIFLWSRFE